MKEKGHTTQSETCERCEKWIGDQPQQSVRDIIEVYELYVSDIDYAGGVDMGIAFTNTSDKTIKYIHFYVRPYNAVGDSLSCDIRGYSNFDAYLTGPLEPSYEGYHRYGDNGYAANSWSECWYYYDVSYIELYGIWIYLQKAMEKFPESALIHTHAGDVLRSMKRYEEAFVHWKRALEMEPQWFDSAYSMGFCYEEIGEYEKAAEVFSQIADTRESRGYEGEVALPRMLADQCWKKLAKG